jgi:hypothetical protein
VALESHMSLDPVGNENPNPPDPGKPESGQESRSVIGARAETAPVWLQRVSLLILVLFCVYLGVLVMILPWWKGMWDDNLFIQSRPMLAHLLRLGAVRGLISGFGVIDIWIGVSEAVHYRDQRR